MFQRTWYELGWNTRWYLVYFLIQVWHGEKTTSRQTGVVECMRGSEREAVEILRSLMDPSVAESLQALERTAAWVNQVAQMRQMVRVICVLFFKRAPVELDH